MEVAATSNPSPRSAVELQRRGHEVRMAVPPNMLGFVESAGLDAVAYGPSSEAVNEEDFVRNFWNISTPVKVVRRGKYYLGEVWAEMGDDLDVVGRRGRPVGDGHGPAGTRRQCR